MPCIKFAVVTAMLGSRDRMLPAPKQECAQFFLFTKWTQIEHANSNAFGWTDS